MSRRLAVALAAGLLASCGGTLPDQDRRIVQTAPDVKLSADVFWKDFQVGAPAAARRYHGRAVEFSGVVTRIDQRAGGTAVVFTQANDHGIVANLLDDDAAAIVKAATPGQRLTLKCFCEGFQADIILKSCVKP